jgi:hypothetical protein
VCPGSDAPCCSHAGQLSSGLPPANAPVRDDLAELAAHLYECRGMSTYRIGEVIGLDRQRVRRLLAVPGSRSSRAAQAGRGSAVPGNGRWMS